MTEGRPVNKDSRPAAGTLPRGDYRAFCLSSQKGPDGSRSRGSSIVKPGVSGVLRLADFTLEAEAVDTLRRVAVAVGGDPFGRASAGIEEVGLAFINRPPLAEDLERFYRSGEKQDRGLHCYRMTCVFFAQLFST